MRVLSGFAVMVVVVCWVLAGVEWGPVGAQTRQGIQGYRQFDSGGIRDVDGSVQLLRGCLGRQRVLGGGCRADTSDLRLVSSFPMTDPQSGAAAWACEWAGTASQVHVEAHAICADR